jgi:hypothetical protein
LRANRNSLRFHTAWRESSFKRGVLGGEAKPPDRAIEPIIPCQSWNGSKQGLIDVPRMPAVRDNPPFIWHRREARLECELPGDIVSLDANQGCLDGTVPIKSAGRSRFRPALFVDCDPRVVVPDHARILDVFWTRLSGKSCNMLILLASPTGFEPVLPP